MANNDEKLEVYLADQDANDPRLNGSVFECEDPIGDGEEIYDDFTPSLTSRDWTAPRFANIWVPRKLKETVNELNDFPRFYTVFGLSQRAVDSLFDLLEPNGELLPVEPRAGKIKYYAYNVTRVIDALDQQESIVERYSPSAIPVSRVEHYEFKTDLLAGAAVFRIPDRIEDIYVTQEFVSRAQRDHLFGLRFMKVWPLVRGTNWVKLGKANQRNVQSHTVADKKVGDRQVSLAPSRSKSKQKASVSQASFRPLASGMERASLMQSRRQYVGQLGINPANMSADKLQAWISDRLIELHYSTDNAVDKADKSFWLGVAWGEALIREFGWIWVMIRGSSGKETTGVVSPDTKYGIAVFTYIDSIATGGNLDRTSQLLFNMIQAGDLPKPSREKLLILG